VTATVVRWRTRLSNNRSRAHFLFEKSKRQNDGISRSNEYCGGRKYKLKYSPLLIFKKKKKRRSVFKINVGDGMVQQKEQQGGEPVFGCMVQQGGEPVFGCMVQQGVEPVFGCMV
jgi:hypothetical protein